MLLLLSPTVLALLFHQIARQPCLLARALLTLIHWFFGPILIYFMLAYLD